MRVRAIAAPRKEDRAKQTRRAYDFGVRWEFTNRWEKIVRLRAIAPGARDATTTHVRDAFSDVGAWITDVHLFAGLQTVLNFEVTPSHALALGEALAGAGLALDAESREVLAAAAGRADETIEGTLAIVFAHGDADLRHEVPSVPG